MRVEWRREESKNINDPFVQTGINETAAHPNATGGFEVRRHQLDPGDASYDIFGRYLFVGLRARF